MLCRGGGGRREMYVLVLSTDTTLRHWKNNTWWYKTSFAHTIPNSGFFFSRVFLHLSYHLRVQWDTVLIAAAFHIYIYMYIPNNKENMRYKR